MKKMVSIILAIAFCFCAQAKTTTEIVAEYESYAAANLQWWKCATKTYNNNIADIPALFDAWKTTPAAKFAPWEKAFAALKLSAEQTAQEKIMRRVFAIYLSKTPSAITGTPARVAITTLPEGYLSAVATDNPTAYTELKASGFILDGEKLPWYAILNLAASAGDIDYIKSLSVNDGMQAEDIYLKKILPTLLDSSDVESAKNKIREIENWLIKNGKYDSANMTKVQAVSKALTSRLVDSKILGK